MKQLENFLAKYRACRYHEVEDVFASQIDDMHQKVIICNTEYKPSGIMKHLNRLDFQATCLQYANKHFTEYRGYFYLNDDYKKAMKEYNKYLQNKQKECTIEERETI